MTSVFASPPEPGTRPRYPFGEWLDGRRWVLTRGRDFWGSDLALVRSIQSAANSRRVRVHIDCTNRSAIVVQGLGPLPPRER